MADERGFTLVELVSVIVVVGILAIVAIPRFLDRSAFESRGFHDETISLLRYAQKTAIAQRRTVCVTLNSSGATLAIVSSSLSVDCAASVPLSIPNPPRGGSGLSATPSSFKYLASGATDQAANVAIAIAGADAITVDAVTGYVY